MKAEELRIRNWVKHPDYEHPIQVNAYGILVCSEKEHFEPIPLIEEWILKAGFVNNELDLGEGASIWFYQDEYYLAGPGCPNENYAIKVKMDFVHQLQNLFFALTGTEVQFKTEETK
jgi:hypothetical protein